MDNTQHVVLTIKSYENILNYLSTTQIYKNVAQLISELVNDVNDNSKTLIVMKKPVNIASKLENTNDSDKDDNDNENLTIK